LCPLPPPPFAQSVLDGDLCEAFSSRPLERQRVLAKDLDRSPAEVFKKLEDARSRVF
jgi:splicing factor 3B subunit 3